MKKKLIIENNNFKHPYCVVDGVGYQLEFVRDILRFPNTKKSHPDLNVLIKSYYDGEVDIEEIWREYTETGSSLDLVQGIFSPHGINNHTVTQGTGKCKDITLYSGDKFIDEQYNYTKEEEAYANVWNIIVELADNFVDDKEIIKEN